MEQRKWLDLSSHKGGPELDGSREKRGELSFPERSRLSTWGLAPMGDRVGFLVARPRLSSFTYPARWAEH